MITLSRNQFITRWDSLPQTLRVALFSEENSAILWHVCTTEHLSEDKIAVVAAITGQAILGLTHPEDVPKQIKAELNLNQDIANAIYEEIDRKIFSPIRADLQKVYSPVTGAGFSPKTEAAVPSENVVNLKPAPAQVPVLETIPIVLVKEDTAKADKEKLAKLLAVGSTFGPRESMRDEPFMLHKVTEVKPDETTPVDKRSRGGLFWFAGSGKLPEKQTKAKIQIEEDKTGKSEYKTESKIVSTPQAPMRIVHYSQFKTPVSPFGEEKKSEVGSGKLETKQEPIKAPTPPKPFDATQGKPEAPKGISMVGKAPQPTSAVRPSSPPVTPLAPRIIKPEVDVSGKYQVSGVKKDIPQPTPEPKAPLRDINITMNMGTPAPRPAKEGPKISYVSQASRAEPPPLQVNEVPRESIPKTSGAKDQNININISVTPPAQGIPMVGKSVSQGAENRKQEPILLIPEVPEFKPKVVAPDVSQAPAKKIDDDVVDLRTFEIKKSTNSE